MLVTMHRPSNVDVPSVLEGLVGMLMASPFTGHQLVWPMHPRTRANLEKLNLFDALAEAGHVCLVEPVGYLEMLCLLDNARLVMTDSGGLQEESCVLGAPCLTMRWNTERPVTLEEHGGTCCLVGNDVDKIREAFIRKVGQAKAPHRPELWDGHTAERIVAVLASTRE